MHPSNGIYIVKIIRSSNGIYIIELCKVSLFTVPRVTLGLLGFLPPKRRAAAASSARAAVLPRQCHLHRKHAISWDAADGILQSQAYE